MPIAIVNRGIGVEIETVLVVAIGIPIHLTAVEAQAILAVEVIGVPLVEDHLRPAGRGPDPSSHGEGAGADDVGSGAQVNVAALTIETEGLSNHAGGIADAARDGAVVAAGAAVLGVVLGVVDIL